MAFVCTSSIELIGNDESPRSTLRLMSPTLRQPRLFPELATGPEHRGADRVPQPHPEQHGVSPVAGAARLDAALVELLVAVREYWAIRRISVCAEDRQSCEYVPERGATHDAPAPEPASEAAPPRVRRRGRFV